MKMVCHTVSLFAFLAAGTNAAQWPNWRPQHGPNTWPGWEKPSVYTPAEPSITWPHHWTTHWQSTSEVATTSSTDATSPATSVSGSTTSVTSTATSVTSAKTTDACASVSKLAASFTSASPKATPTVPAGLAYECINSVPFNSSAAVAFLDSLRPYLDWQTTIEYLKDPPAEYAEKIQPSYDFWANFERIYSAAQSNAYANEYAFGFEVYEAFQIAHDGHFVVYPDSVNAVFSYGRTAPLVSVSVDGVSVPEVYVYSDVLSTIVGNATFTPSPLALIDGKDSTQWLLEFSQYGSLQDRDALWNNVFYENAQVALGSSGTGLGTFAGGGRGRWIYPGPATNLTFVNGSSITLENFARVLVPFDNITSGSDIYQQYFAVPSGLVKNAYELASQSSTSTTTRASMTFSTSSVMRTAPASTSSSAASTSIPAPGYPSPIVREMSNLNSGYFLEGAGYDDVAVLSIPSFVSSEADELPFQSVNTYLINRAIAENKTKLIIDVSANGGGTILQGYDIFKQLFPQILPYGATRFRAHEAHDLIGQEISYFSGLVPRSLNTNASTQNNVASNFNYRSDADVNYEPFTSWPEKFGPHAFGPEPDNFTSIIRWNMSDVLTPDNSGGIYISGYLNRSNITTQPFAAENIVIVYDGYCASTCTIFSELMRQQGGVKTIALGGRPTTDIIQAVGGVKGTNDFPYDYILSEVEFPFTYEYLHSAEYYNNTALGAYNNLWEYRTTNAVVNSRDGIREGDQDEMPLQFVYEEADCRIYYTPEMVVDETAIWKTVADSAFGGIDHCAAGGLGAASKVRRQGREKHAVRRGMSTSEHSRAMDEVWTGKGGITLGGDSVMIV